jgi:hypothetical protein
MMRMSISRSWEKLWVWLFWGLAFWLVMELGPFLIAAQVLNKTAGELAGPYLAFAVPWAIMATLIWWLRKWDERGVSPKRLAHGWSLSVALFGVAMAIAVSYSGVKLGFMYPMDAIGGLAVFALLSVSISYFTMYHRVLRVTSARAAGKRGSA